MPNVEAHRFSDQLPRWPPLHMSYPGTMFTEALILFILGGAAMTYPRLKKEVIGELRLIEALAKTRFISRKKLSVCAASS